MRVGVLALGLVLVSQVTGRVTFETMRYITQVTEEMQERIVDVDDEGNGWGKDRKEDGGEKQVVLGKRNGGASADGRGDGDEVEDVSSRISKSQFNRDYLYSREKLTFSLDSSSNPADSLL
jgi:hypothetical protein